MLAEADQLVVLSDDLGGATRKVQCEGGLVCPEIINVEDELFGKVLGVTPDDLVVVSV